MASRSVARWRRLSTAIPAIFLVARAVAAQDQPPPALHLSGFADSIVSRSLHSDTTDLDFGELDPYATVRFSDSWTALCEVLVQRVERGSDADESRHRAIELDLERLFVAYAPSDAFRLEAGALSSGLLAWNEREERPRFLQTSIDMPAIARRQEQGGAWPLHFLGAWASGRVGGSAGLSYGLGVGRGRARTRDDIGPISGAGSAAGLISLAIAPEGLDGWEAGAAAFLDQIPAREGTYNEMDVSVSSSFVRGPIEIRTEWSRMDHRLAGRAHVTQGWYALASSRMPGAFRKFRPYALLDHLDVAGDEPYLAGVRSQRAWAVGTRWDATPALALKLDFRSQRARSPERERLVRLELAVAF